jgi:hypothetical protein
MFRRQAPVAQEQKSEGTELNEPLTVRAACQMQFRTFSPCCTAPARKHPRKLVFASEERAVAAAEFAYVN